MSDDERGSLGNLPLRPPLLAVALYLVAFALLADGVGRAIVVGGSAAPFGSLRWRFGMLGVLFLYMAYPLLGMAIGSLTAAVLRQRSMLLLFGVVQVVLTSALLGCFLLFLLDAAQVAATVPPQMRGGYTITVAQTSLNGGLAVILFAALTWATFSAFRQERHGRGRPAASGGAILVRR